MPSQVSGTALASVLAGTLLLYAGIRGVSLGKAVQAVVQGKNPATVPQAQPITGGGTAAAATAGTTATVSGGTVQKVLQQVASGYGWGSGAEWQALQSLEISEAGFSLTAKNPNSDAYGIAQLINGPSEYYQYGGDPVTAQGQATAMCNYIQQRYGDPIAAWQFHRANGYY